MKGIYIFEEAFLKDAVACLKLSNIEHIFKCEFGKTITEEVDLHALIEGTASKSRCNKDDTYDFETGALIALMKMCGVEKVKKAAKETFFDVAENSVNEYEEKIHALEEEIKCLKIKNKYFIEDINRKFDYITELKHSNNVLEEENEKLKLDCEKLQHGYNDMIFCGGRQNGKQYTFLVELFKKIPKDKVQAAYVTAYKESLIWCTSQPSIRDSLTVDSLIEKSRAFTRKFDYEWYYKKPTKREEMWNNIKNFEGSSCIEVNRADIIDFLEDIEKEIPEAHWSTGAKPTAINPMFDYKYAAGYNKIYFFVGEDRITFGYDEETSREKVQYVTYLPPMRWDLFKKGRIVVGVKNNNELKEFRKEVEINTGIKDVPTCPTNLCLFYSFDKDNYKIILETVEKPNIAKINGHKVYYWEDVR